MAEEERLGVTHLIQQIRLRLEPLNQVTVFGEVANCNRHRSGNLYFVLKDRQSQIQCMMPALAARRLQVPLTDGIQVVVFGSVRVYAERGALQLTVALLRPDGLGQLFAALEKLKRQLAEEGLFDASRKRRLPFLPRRVAVITSPYGAVLHDIFTTLRRRNPAVDIWLVPAAVQGQHAPEEIIAALRLVYRHRAQIDCLILARGGGSLEDLMPFNHEALIRILATFPVPLVSAIGHETDTTLCDLVADIRAATPTAAAEMIAPVRLELLRDLRNWGTSMRRSLVERVDSQKRELLRIRTTTLADYPQRRLERERERITNGKIRLHTAMPRRLEKERHNLRHLEVRLATFQPDRLLEGHRREVTALRASLERSMTSLLERNRTAGASLRPLLDRSMAAVWERNQSAVKGMRAYLEALSPLRVLDRGYTLCLDDEGRPVTRASGRKAQERLEVRFFDGSLSCRVEAAVDGLETNSGSKRTEL